MPQYIQFQTFHTEIQDDTGAETKAPPLLVEVQEAEAPRGIAKAGLRDAAEKTIAQAKTLLDDAIRTALSTSAIAFYNAIQSLPTPPTETEISFGLKITGEVGNIAISKAGAEANYNVKLIWKTPGATK
jgi:hypothetical protein